MPQRANKRTVLGQLSVLTATANSCAGLEAVSPADLIGCLERAEPILQHRTLSHKKCLLANLTMSEQKASEQKETSDQPSTSTGAVVNSQPEQNRLKELLDRLAISKQHRKEAKSKYAFWETQPVMQFSEDGGSSVSVLGLQN